MIDSHCHLDFPDFAEEGVQAVVARAVAAGVDRMMTISTHLSKYDRILEVANTSPHLYASVGTHPHQASEEAEKAFTTADIVRMSQPEKIIAIGECGLDYYYDYATKEDQHAVFARHIEAGLETGLPLIIHSRDAEEDTIRLIRDAGQGKSRGVMHCFTGSQKLADEALALGYYISFSGILTFKKSEDLRAVAFTVPLDRLLVETDSPYLAPMPYRGKRNEPAYVMHTAQMLAMVKGVTAAEIDAITTRNFYTLFNKAKPS